MKKLLLILLCLPFIGFGQQTYVPDDNFEQKLIDLGLDNILDDYVDNINIYNTTSLSLLSSNISDLTGIEGFVNLNTLFANDNQLTNLDLSNNINLTMVFLTNNQLNQLNVSTLVNLTRLECNYNNLTSIDLSNNILLEQLRIKNNNLNTLNLSNNPNLFALTLSYNFLTYLDLRNGNNTSINPDLRNNFFLYCINVDDTLYSTNNWSYRESQHYFSTNCPTTSIQEYPTSKELLKVTDLLGREAKETNQPLFYIYDDGTVEKRIVIE